MIVQKFNQIYNWFWYNRLYLIIINPVIHNLINKLNINSHKDWVVILPEQFVYYLN